MRIPRIFINQKVVSTATISLPEDKAHHIQHVLRLRVGDQIKLFNNSGLEFKAEITEVTKKVVRVQVKDVGQLKNESPLAITLCLAVSRGPHMDFSIQKAVELGVTAIIPIISEFGNVKLTDNRIDNKLLHWTKIIIGAAEQSGRNRLAELQSPVTFNEWINSESIATKLIIHPGAEQTMSKINLQDNKLTLMIGAEGGFSDLEFQKALDSNYIPVSLGPRILRTETAVACSVSNAQQLWGDLN
jgi:16S rRNA (uracil1498-N3)-methyltransferase